ncbi:hypothetical protein MMC30_000095 [Trapelia coarctata]|nr:hypothetical protein [Trapelia coarctata]
MRGSLYALAASVFLGIASAGKHAERRHAHEAYHLLKKNAAASSVSSTDNATCGCTTIYSTYYGEATLVPISHPAASPSTAPPAPPAPPATSTATAAAAPPPPPPPPASTEAAPPPPPASSTAAAAPASSPHVELQNGSSAPIKSGSQWAMTYSPYTSSGGCKDAGSVASDIASIAAKGFSTVRLYSTDCGGLANVAAAASSHGLSLIIGIYIDNKGIGAAAPQIQDITDHFGANYGMVEMVVVGNEAVFNHFCSAGQLAAFISQVKATLKGAGYNGPVTTTEPMSTLSEITSIICPVIDVVAANIHPFFNSDIEASQAGQFVAKSLQDLAGYCPGKPEVFNLETGWPSQGQPNGNAVPGASQQAKAVKSIVEAAGGKSAVFSFVDDLWKGEGEFGVERSWGCSQLFG